MSSHPLQVPLPLRRNHSRNRQRMSTMMRTTCNILQHAATRCNTLQHTATRHRLRRSTMIIATCNTLHAATHCNAMQVTATRNRLGKSTMIITTCHRGARQVLASRQHPVPLPLHRCHSGSTCTRKRKWGGGLRKRRTRSDLLHLLLRLHVLVCLHV